MLCCYARRLVGRRCMYGSRSESLWSKTHPPFRRRRRRSPVRDHFVRDGSAPPALTSVVSDDRRFGRVVDKDDDGSPSQSVSNFDRVATSSSCSSSLLVSVFVVVLLLPKLPAQVRVPPRFRVGVIIILHCDAATIIALPILPPNEQRADVDHRHRHRRDRRTPERRREPSRRRRGRRCRIRRTPPPPSPPTPLLTRYRSES